MINHDYVRIRTSNFCRISHGIFRHIGRETSYLVFFATAMAMCLDPKLPSIGAQKEGGKVDESGLYLFQDGDLGPLEGIIYIMF